MILFVLGIVRMKINDNSSTPRRRKSTAVSFFFYNKGYGLILIGLLLHYLINIGAKLLVLTLCFFLNIRVLNLHK